MGHFWGGVEGGSVGATGQGQGGGCVVGMRLGWGRGGGNGAEGRGWVELEAKMEGGRNGQRGTRALWLFALPRFHFDDPARLTIAV